MANGVDEQLMLQAPTIRISTAVLPCRGNFPLPFTLRHAAKIAQFLLFAVIVAVTTPSAFAQGGGADKKNEPIAPPRPLPGIRNGAMITIKGVIDTSVKNRVISETRTAVRNGAEVIVYDIMAAPSDFGPCLDLARDIAELGGKVQQTVAYVSKPLTGHGVLVALACDEIVMAPGARIGDVYRDQVGGGNKLEQDIYKQIAVSKAHGSEIPLGMVDKNVRIFEVETTNAKRYVTEEQLEALSKQTRILRSEVIKEKGQRLLLDAEQARKLGLAKLIADSRRDVALMYNLPESAAADDKLFAESTRPVLLKLEGTVNSKMTQYVLRRLQQAQLNGDQLLFVEIDSSHGQYSEAQRIAQALRDWPGAKVAWVPRQATGVATLIIFGCDKLVTGESAQLGGFQVPGMAPQEYSRLAQNATELSRGSEFPKALVEGFIDPSTVVYEVRNKERPGIPSYRTETELADPQVARVWEKSRPGPIKDRDSILRMDGKTARSYDFALGNAEKTTELQTLFNLGDQPIPVLENTWVDQLVDILTSPGATVFLLVVGFSCLYIEFNIPGFGIAGLLSALCFTLWFWAQFLSNTAGSLEICLFLLGLVMIAAEIFILPGFGVSGAIGVVLLISSLILARQSFTLPQTEEQTWEMAGNLVTLIAALVVTAVAIGFLTRYFPSVPYFNRMILSPPDNEEEEAGYDRDSFDEPEATPYDHLLGQHGTTASPLRPAGRMQLGGEYYDVVAQGSFIETGKPVEVIEVYRNRIIVRPADLG